MTAENPTPRIADAIGYVGEIAEPNGPAVKGYFLTRWADERQPQFEEFVTQRERRAAARAIERASAWLTREGHSSAGTALLKAGLPEVTR